MVYKPTQHLDIREAWVYEAVVLIALSAVTVASSAVSPPAAALDSGMEKKYCWDLQYPTALGSGCQWFSGC